MPKTLIQRTVKVRADPNLNPADYTAMTLSSVSVSNPMTRVGPTFDSVVLHAMWLCYIDSLESNCVASRWLQVGGQKRKQCACW